LIINFVLFVSFVVRFVFFLVAALPPYGHGCFTLPLPYVSSWKPKRNVPPALA
jgi:hypothetical protein